MTCIKIGQLISDALSRVGNVPTADIDDITEFLNHDEWGIALETLCAVIYDEQLKIPTDAYELIVTAGTEMNMFPETWESLIPLCIEQK